MTASKTQLLTQRTQMHSKTGWLSSSHATTVPFQVLEKLFSEKKSIHLQIGLTFQEIQAQLLSYSLFKLSDIRVSSFRKRKIKITIKNLSLNR